MKHAETKNLLGEAAGKMSLTLPKGWLGRMDESAMAAEQTRAEWTRNCIRRGFDLIRKQAGK